MSDNDTAPATQRDVQYLALLVSENRTAIEKIESRFERLDSQIDDLDQRLDRRFGSIERMFQTMTRELTNHDERIRSIELAS